MPHVSPLHLSALIASIYDCVLEPARWDGTLVAISRLLGSEKAILALNSLRENRVVIDRSIGWDSDWLEKRGEHLAEINGVVGAWLRKRSSLDDPLVASRCLSDTEMLASPYVRHCLMPQGIVDVAHFVLLSTSAEFSELVLFWQEGHGAARGSEVELGMLLLPHLRRAVSITNVLGARTIERDRLAETVDSLALPVILVAYDGAIVHANNAAERMLCNANALFSVQGRLRARLRSANDAIYSTLVAGATELEMGSTGIAITLGVDDSSPAFAHVLPLRGSQVRLGGEPAACAAVFVSREPNPQRGAATLARTCGLTGAEARVLASLAAGLTLPETAGALGIALTTARTHLTHIFLKTGTARQADLIRLALQAAGPI